MKRGYERSQRVADLIQKSLAQIILEEMADDSFRLVTITGVSVSRDLSYAKVFISVLKDDPEQIKQMIDVLNDSSKALRYSLAQAVDLRIVPQLKFVYDESTVRGFRISKLINSAMSKTDKKTDKE